MPATCAVSGGAESWDSSHESGRAQELLFRWLLQLPNGISGADTLERVFAKLDPMAFGRWMAGRARGPG